MLFDISGQKGDGMTCCMTYIGRNPSVYNPDAKVIYDIMELCSYMEKNKLVKKI